MGDHDLLSVGSLQFFLQGSDNPTEQNDCHNTDTFAFTCRFRSFDERIQNIDLIFG